MRIDEQMAAIESETQRVLEAICRKLGGHRFHIGTRQFEDVGKVYERRGGPFAKKFLQTRIRDSRRDEATDFQRLGDVLDLLQESSLDIHAKAFIVRKLRLILEHGEGRQRR